MASPLIPKCLLPCQNTPATRVLVAERPTDFAKALCALGWAAAGAGELNARRPRD